MGFIRNKKNIKYWPDISFSKERFTYASMPVWINKHKIFLNVSNSLTALQKLRRNTEAHTEPQISGGMQGTCTLHNMKAEDFYVDEPLS